MKYSEPPGVAPRPALRPLPRWPRHLALWVAVGGVLGATQCRWIRPASAPRKIDLLWDGPLPSRPDVLPSVVVHVPHRAPIRHVVGI